MHRTQVTVDAKPDSMGTIVSRRVQKTPMAQIVRKLRNATGIREHPNPIH